MGWTPLTRDMLSRSKDIEVTVEYKSVLEDYWVYDRDTQSNTKGQFTSRLEFSSSR